MREVAKGIVELLNSDLTTQRLVKYLETAINQDG